ncbi:MAG TPA: glycoside hydrolase family 3 N-terminal domain-containing protein [Streptosporangiales bacterium]
MRRALAAVAAGCLLLAGCTRADDGSGSGGPASPSGPTSAGTATPTPTAGSLPGGWGPTDAELAEAQRLVAKMTVREKVGSLLMPQFTGRSATSVTSAEAKVNEETFGVRTISAAIRRYHLGGVIVMPQNVTDAKQVARLNAGIAAAGRRDAGAALPLLVGVDQEGGTVQRVKAGATTYPAAASIGRTGEPAYARLLARDNGVELRAMGFTLDFAPDADVGFDSPAIGTRSYAATPKRAAAMVTAAVDGYRRGGVVAVVKHFPGHGSAGTDSHRTLPRITRSRAALDRIDLVPFRSAVRAQVPGVLTAHLDIRAVDPGRPSSVSRKVVTGMLRHQLGFNGVAFTDSEEMEPIAGHYGPAEGAVRAVLAGEDVVLMPKDVRAAYRGLLEAARSGRISTRTLDQAVVRVTALRLYAKRIGAGKPSLAHVPWAKHRADVRKVLAHA